MQHLNSFQQWASDYARAFGFIVTPSGNRVTLDRDDLAEPLECFTVQGVQAAIDQRSATYRTDLTPAGEQFVIPGCERRPPENGKPAQLSLF